MTVEREQVAQALRDAFEGECRELGLDARLEILGDRITPCFAGQFGAQGDWLASTLLEELQAHGVKSADPWSVHPAEEAELERLVGGVRTALRRTRARLVDTNSWNRGGLEWPFPIADPVVRARGLAIYRAPALHEATVRVGSGRVSIRFPRGDCGEVASSGIWVPTALDGDFDVEVEYRLPDWHPGEREACLGLFAVAVDGTFRTYAQRVTCAGAPARVVADLDGTPGTVTFEATAAHGALRLAREQGLLSAWHRADGGWTRLGDVRETRARRLLVGAKIWALGECGPLVAELDAFRLAATPAAEQIPLPPSRPDPRSVA